LSVHQRSGAYTMLENCASLDELAGPSLIETSQEGQLYHRDTLEEARAGEPSNQRHEKSFHRARHISSDSYTIPDSYANLSELAAPLPVENPQEGHLYHHSTLEESRSREQIYQRNEKHNHDDRHTETTHDEQSSKAGPDGDSSSSGSRTGSPHSERASKFAMQLRCWARLRNWAFKR